MSCEQNIHFIFPINGDMLNQYDGVETADSLTICVRVGAPENHVILINGTKATYDNGEYKANVTLDGKFNRIEAIDETEAGRTETITVYWVKNAKKRYRIAVDDVIWALRDIYQNQDSYQTIFDNPYLAMFKRLHDDFGTIAHFNLFYETDGFNLSMMPDKYKKDWKESSSWLTLSFHAKGEFPDWPYTNASYQQVFDECKMVEDEILRFAGPEVMNQTSCIHWCSPNVHGARALRTRGTKLFLGYYYLEDGKPFVSNYLNVEQTSHLEHRDYWYDRDEDITHVKVDLILNLTKKEELIPKLEALVANDHTGSYIQFLNHEQYFYDFYQQYQPDYEEKMRIAAQFLQDHGYIPTKVEDLLLK